MASSYTDSANKPAGPPVAMIVAGLVVLALIAWFVYARFMPRTEVITLKDTPNIVWLKQKAREAQGDFSRLSPMDQQRANQLSSNMGAVSIRRYWQEQNKK